MFIRVKKKTGSSNTTVEENEAIENALAETKSRDSVTVNMEESSVDKLTCEEAKDGEHEKMNSEEGETKHDEKNSELGGKVVEVDNAENAITTESNGHNTAADQNISEDDEIDGQETVMWEDDEEDDEEYDEDNVASEDGFSDEHATEEEDDDDGDEISEEEATEEEEDGEEDEEEEEEDEEEAEEDEDNTKQEEEGNTKEGKGIAKGNGGKAEERSKEEKGIPKGNGGKAEEKTKEEKGIPKGDGGSAEEHNSKKVEVTPKNIEKSKERSKKKKTEAQSSKKVELGDKPESSRSRKSKQRVESMGMIFICSSKTKNDCYQYRVLGLPEAKKDMVKKIYTGMRLFLYDVDLKLMYGIYKAAGPGGYNIEPKAFKSQFPSQVRFKVLDDCLPLPEEKFKKVIKENYYTNTKFDCVLKSEQVNKLCKLFVSSSKKKKPKKLGGTRTEKLFPVRRERIRRPRPAEERRLPLREERVYRERPRKRPRKAIVPLPPLRRPLTPPPVPTTVRSYAYDRTLDVDSYRRDPYLERRSPLRDGRDPLRKRHDPYLERRSPYRERDPLSSRRDPYLERSYTYRDDPVYVERRDVYRDGRDDPYPERRRDYRDGRDSYLERRDPVRDERGLYIERDLYRDGRDAYVERHGLYRDVPEPRSETYSSSYNRRDPILDRRDVFRDDRGVEYRDSFRREEVLDRQPLSLDLTSRRVSDIGGARDAYVSYRERPSYTEPVYSTEYPSRVGLPREYHL